MGINTYICNNFEYFNVTFTKMLFILRDKEIDKNCCQLKRLSELSVKVKVNQTARQISFKLSTIR